MTMDEKLRRIRELADELDRLATNLGMRLSASLCGQQCPTGVELSGGPYVTCHGGANHTTHRSGHIGRVAVIVDRKSSTEEVAAELMHEPACSFFRCPQCAGAGKS